MNERLTRAPRVRDIESSNPRSVKSNQRWNCSPPIHHLRKSCVALAQCCGDGHR